MKLSPLKTHKTFEGLTQFWEHESTSTKTKMKFSTFTPPGGSKGAVIWLSGLTCTEENFITKAGAQKTLAELGLMVICPDTSPRGLNLPGEHDAYDFGSGAGFYVDATTPGYRDHYRMFTYIQDELHGLIQREFGLTADQISIMGHSMGGHGALILGLNCPEKFQSVSAFAPIAHPSQCAWGEKALTGYLGEDRSTWKRVDATELILGGARHPRSIWIDQGQDDEFLHKGQLRPEDLVAACQAKGQKLEYRILPGYDHSYYFISTFVADHLRFHAAALGLA